MNVLSLFDGISCGQLALRKEHIKYDNYFASEIDVNAIKITQRNFPNTIQLGDVCNLDSSLLPKIDLLLGGSPCQSFSGVISNNKGFDGKSRLFFEYLRILNECKPKYFLLENVEMKKEYEAVITNYIGVSPIHINSSYFSAQSRPRLYWTNIPVSNIIPTNYNTLEDVLETKVDEKYFYKESFDIVGSGSSVVEAILNINGHDILKRVNHKKHKCQCLTAVCGGNQQKKVIDHGRVRKLTPLEYERLQTIPDNYTDGVSDSARYKAIGNAWNVNTIAFILCGLCERI